MQPLYIGDLFQFGDKRLRLKDLKQIVKCSNVGLFDGKKKKNSAGVCVSAHAWRLEATFWCLFISLSSSYIPERSLTSKSLGLTHSSPGLCL